MEGEARIQSVARALTIIDTMAEAGGELALNEISSRLRLAKTTVHGLISTLKAFGYVQQSTFNGKYRLGVRLFEVGNIVSNGWEVRVVAVPYIQKLVEEMGETVHLALLDKHEVLYIDKRESSGSLRIVSQVGMRLPAHCTGVGKVLMAHLPPEERRRIIELKGLQSYTRNTITEPAALEAEFERVRKQGYAIDNEEIMDSLRCVAAPIRDQGGKVISAVSISGPVSRMQGERFEKALDLCVATAHEISAGLGYRENPPRQGSTRYC